MTGAKAKSIRAIVTVTCAILLVLCLGILLFAARAARGSGQYPFMSWSGTRHMFGRMFATDDQDNVRLSEFGALEPIHSHSHIALTTPEFVAMLQRLHARVLDILLVNDRQPYRATLAPRSRTHSTSLLPPWFTHSCAQPSTGSHSPIPTLRRTRLRD